jgi:hypothetical protein
MVHSFSGNIDMKHREQKLLYLVFRGGSITNSGEVSCAIELRRLVEEAKDLSTGLLSTGLLVIHDSEGGGQHHVTELTGRKHIDNPLLHVLDGHIETGGDHTTLVDTADKLDNDLAIAVIVEDGEVTDVSILLHGLEELDDHLGRGAEEHLPLSTLLSVTDRLQDVGQHGHFGHLEERRWATREKGDLERKIKLARPLMV